MVRNNFLFNQHKYFNKKEEKCITEQKSKKNKISSLLVLKRQD